MLQYNQSISQLNSKAASRKERPLKFSLICQLLHSKPSCAICTIGSLMQTLNSRNELSSISTQPKLSMCLTQQSTFSAEFPVDQLSDIRRSQCQKVINIKERRERNIFLNFNFKNQHGVLGFWGFGVLGVAALETP